MDDRMRNGKGGANLRLARMLGTLTMDKHVMPAEIIPNANRSKYAQTKWKMFLRDDAPIISSRCCSVMKKSPAHKYQRKTGRKVITAEMASESRLRTQAWIRNGCNAFDAKTPKSMPMAFWTENDVLQYIKENNLPLASVYGDVVADSSDQVAGQMRMNIDGEIEEDPCLYKTTGVSRSGCMFCGYGCHLEKPGEGRFLKMKQTHPKQYEWIMKPWSEGGLGYKEVIDWINENAGTHIEY